MIVVVAEKPSVARDIARVLGARERGEGCLRGDGYVVTWAIGHLVQLARPSRSTRAGALAPRGAADAPGAVAAQRHRADARPVRGGAAPGLRATETREVVCATDAGREGELIFRYITERRDLRKPVRRLWISSLTDEAIREGFRAAAAGRATSTPWPTPRAAAAAPTGWWA